MNRYYKLVIFDTEQKVNLCLQAEDKALALSFYSASPPKKSSKGFLGPKKSSERFFRNPQQTHTFRCGYKSEGFGDNTMKNKYTWRNYIEYMKDNPKGLWFKMRLYGWGWVPVKWQGWMVVVIGIALVIAGIYIGEADDAPGAALIGSFL